MIDGLPEPTNFELLRGDAVLVGSTIGKGPAILLLHAGLERRQVWIPVVSQILREASVRCVFVDQRGHGESTGQTDRVQPFADDATAMVRHLDAPCVVVGSSLGGLAAVGALADAEVASQVAGVILVDVIPELDPTRARTFLSASNILAKAEPLANDVFDCGQQLKESLMAYTGPTVLAVAERSAMNEVDIAKFQAHYRRAEAVRIPECGHLVARDNPAALGRLIADRAAAWLGL